MKNFFSLAFFFCIAFGLQAQKCDFLLNEKGHKKVIVSVSKTEQVWLSNDNGAYSLGLELTYADIRKEKILKGDTLILIVGDAEFITLLAREDALPVGKADERVEQTNYFPVYSLTEPTVEKLSKDLLTGMKIFFGKKDFNTMDIEAKKSKKISEACACVKK